MAKIMKLKEASKELDISYNWLREQALKGLIPAFRSGGDKGTWRVDISQVRAALRERAAQK